MRAQGIQYQKKATTIMNFNSGYVLGWALGIIAGGVAYLNGAPYFLQDLLLFINWSKLPDLVWSFIVALIGGIGGVLGTKIGKYIYDLWLKKVLDRIKKYLSVRYIKKKKKRLIDYGKNHFKQK